MKMISQIREIVAVKSTKSTSMRSSFLTMNAIV